MLRNNLKLPDWFAELSKTPELNRLAGVRFHGALTIHKKNQNVSSRLDHSVCVARLALYLSDLLCLSASPSFLVIEK